MMAERLIFQVIADGVTFLTANPDVITEFLSTEAGLDTAEAAAVSALYLGIKGKTGDGPVRSGPSVVHGYAREDGLFPTYAVTLGGEQEGQTFLGDEGGFIDDETDPDHGADQFAAIFGFTVNVLVYAQHPDMALYLYQLLKETLIASWPLLKSHDLFDLKISGADVAPDAAWAPAGMFLRRATLSFSRQYTQTQVASKLDRAWKVGGIHIQDDERAREIGAVNTHVTVTDPEQT